MTRKDHNSWNCRAWKKPKLSHIVPFQGTVHSADHQGQFSLSLRYYQNPTSVPEFLKAYVPKSFWINRILPLWPPFFLYFPWNSKITFWYSSLYPDICCFQSPMHYFIIFNLPMILICPTPVSLQSRPPNSLPIH